jgi:hypothetical protein
VLKNLGYTKMSGLYENLNLVLFSWMIKDDFEVLSGVDPRGFAAVTLDEFSIFQESDYEQTEVGMKKYLNDNRKNILGRFHNFDW